MSLYKIIFSFTLLFVNVFTAAQANKIEPTNLHNEKTVLVKELMQNLEINRSIEESFFGARRKLERLLADKKKLTSMQKTKAMNLAKENFEKQKPLITKEILEQLEKEFTQRYSDAELKYLIQLVKHPLYKNFKSFLESDTYFASLSLPMNQAEKIAAQYLTEPKPILKDLSN